jgi:hypothetical protein
MGVAAWAFWRGYRGGHITWKFAAAVAVGWLGVASALVWGFPGWRKEGYYWALLVALMVPLARLALCPLAIAANRHR